MSYTATGAANALTEFVDQTLIVHLSTTDPATSVTTPSGNGYPAAGVSLTAPDWGTAVAGSPATITATGLDYGDPSGAWGTLTHFAIYASDGTTLLRYGALAASISPDAPTTSVTVDVTLRQSV